MNLPLHTSLEDVQNTPDQRCLAINQVGIKSLRYPINFKDSHAEAIRVVADFNMYVHLPHHVKGTHMSRFIELLERPGLTLSINNIQALMDEMLLLLEAQSGYIELRFPFFITKKAPVSGVESLMDYNVTLIAEKAKKFQLTVKVEIPVTSLCPCSKKISQYGAHNQRSLVTISVDLNQMMTLHQLVALVEAQASSELYGLLKRPDEKYVTEHAYENPKFVEDMVRDIAGALSKHESVSGFVVECENFESIHNHSAYAKIISE